MIFRETAIPNAYVIDVEPIEDERGFFARTFCAEEFGRRGLVTQFAQCSVSFNHKRGTLRGMHYQAAPKQEAKLVRCTRGAIYDVVLDLRPESPAFRGWVAAEISADDRRMVYVPEGCAHGFQTLTDAAEVLYQISVPYQEELARGVRWDDPAFAINWPETRERTISARDAAYPDFEC